MSLGITELLLIVCFVLLVFGAKRIPEVARALGKASREFKKARDEIDLEEETKPDQQDLSASVKSLSPENETVANEETTATAEQQQREKHAPK